MSETQTNKNINNKLTKKDIIDECKYITRYIIFKDSLFYNLNYNNSCPNCYHKECYNKITITEEDKYIINNYDFKTYDYIENDEMKLLFIISDVLKNQYSEHLKIKDLIKDKKNNNYSKEDKEYLLKDKINYYCNDRINEILNKIIKNQNKNNDNNDKYKLFEKYIKLSIVLFIETINEDKDNLKIMINYAYKLLMFYLTEIKNDYDESARECHILELMTVINNIIYCYIEVTEHNINYNNCIAPFLM